MVVWKNCFVPIDRSIGGINHTTIKLNVGNLERGTLDLSGGFRRGFPNQILTDQTNPMQSSNDATTNLNVRMKRERNVAIIEANIETSVSNVFSKFSITIPPNSIPKKVAAIISGACKGDFIANRAIPSVPS
jgi:hypothetical protein